jgi:hypothetical protein
MSLYEVFIGIKEAYKQYSSGNKERPESSAFTPFPPEQRNARPKSPTHWVRNLGIAGVVMAILAAWLMPSHRKPPVSQASVAENTAQTCPAGVPQVAVTAVQFIPDPDLDPPSEVYMVTGRITNSTTAVLSVSGIGFYVGSADSLRPPDWSESLGNMDVSADPTQIPVGATVLWRDKHIEISDQPASTDISAALSYPDEIDSKTDFQWSWPDASIGCSNPNIFN